jgi:hypothetical protein
MGDAGRSAFPVRRSDQRFHTIDEVVRVIKTARTGDIEPIKRPRARRVSDNGQISLTEKAMTTRAN